MSGARGVVVATRTTVSAVLAVAVVAAALIVGARPASANILAPADASELANLLDDASQQQGVCYGWRVTLDDNYNVPSAGGTFTGSNFGAGTRVADDPRCAKLVIFTAQLIYTSSSSESEDSATWSVSTNIPGADASDLRRHILIEDEDALLGERDDIVLFNAVASLPLAAAEAGLAPPLRPATSVATPPDDAHLTGSPGSDFLRSRGTVLFIFGGILLLGVLWLVLTAATRNQPRPAAAGRPPRQRPYPPQGRQPPRPRPGPPPGQPPP